MSVILAWRMGYFNRTSIKAGDLPHESVGGGISVPAVRLTLSPLGWVSVGRHQHQENPKTLIRVSQRLFNLANEIYLA